MKNKKSFQILIWPFVSLLLFAALLFLERSGVQYSLADTVTDFVPESVINAEKPTPEPECLILYDSKSDFDYQNISFVLDSMSVGYELADVSGEAELPTWNRYRTVVIALTNLDSMQGSILSLLNWVKEGGRVLFTEMPEPNVALKVIYDELGIVNDRLDYLQQNGIKMATDLMPGGEKQEFSWGTNFRYMLGVQLTDDCLVHIVSTGETEIPLLWERNYGKGRIVVNNNDMTVEKESRGLVAAAYSLLEDIFVYPVINASIVFIDDFPTQLPHGNNDIIFQQYHCDTISFYKNIWFPDMTSLTRKYGLKYTGMIIETYGDSVKPPFEPIANADYFSYFGSLLLEQGNEIGLHGYNHMPLVLEDFDYKGILDYTKWKSTDNMAAATAEAVRFAKELFPEIELKTYVPPSNVLSEEGRTMLRANFPQINTISGLYHDDDFGMEQEFGVNEDGLIDLPRITSGYNLDDFYKWNVINELCFHFISSHFIHPDDVLDPERSQGKTWEELKNNFDSFLQWLYEAAPGIRNCTAQEGAMAVQRYSNLSIQRNEEKGKYILDINGFYDGAWLLVRFNKGEPGFVEGGSIEHVTEELYLLRATKDHVVVTVER